MEDDERLSRLIGDIYDAALDVALWPTVLEKIAHFVGGCAAGLLWKDSVSNHGNVHFQFGVSDHYLALYREQYWRYDPLAPLLFSDVGEVTSRTDYMADEEFRAGRFHKEWAQPQGFVDAANVVLEKSATSCALLSIIRSKRDGMVDDEARRRVGLLVPHVRRAVLIGKAIDLKAEEAATLADTFDAVRAGIFLVDTSARIVHANAAGAAMLTAGDPLSTVGTQLAAADASAHQDLRDAFLAAGEGDAEVGTKGVAIPLAARDGERYVAHVLPLATGTRRSAGARYAATAAVFVHKAALDIPSPPEVIARTYKLTPTELRVLLAVVEVGGSPEVAEALGIAESTVKFHLRQLFAKTGVRRQADLVKLVAGFLSPLA